METLMNYKKAFYSKLEDCYLGVKIKDFHKGNIAKSGFSNLLKIKEQYFAHIKAYLESQIESEPLSHDIYNKLFTFFDSYLNESGTPFFTDTPIYKNIYAKVYTNSKDTSLFYKTQNLYYIKSDILYQSLILSDEQENYEVVFDTSEHQQNAGNAKNKVLFKLDSVSCNKSANTDEEAPNQIIIKVLNQKDLFPELNSVFKQNSNEFSEDFLKSLKQKKLKFNEENLKKIFRSYKKQSEIDFFIHKNAKTFLQEQFDLWMFHYLYKDSAIQEWNPNIIAHLQKIKNIAHEIIKLIADFENELKAIWLKPKFAKKTEYVFSVDIILQYANHANVLIESIANDKGFEAQIKEWQELKLIDEGFKKEDFLIGNIYRDTFPSPTTPARGGAENEQTSAWAKDDNLFNINITSSCSPFNANGDIPYSPSLAEGARGWVQALTECDKYRYLPIDTKHFTKETKYKILSSFENLESLLNGELIKSDNFQALNTLMPKYQGKVDLIYIDPPYNTGNDGFIYADNFNHASWLSMMNNRLELARALLNLKGSIFISIDDKEHARLKLACDDVFGEENFVNNIIWKRKRGRDNSAKYFSKTHEYCVVYGKNIHNLYFNLLEIDEQTKRQYKNPDSDLRGDYRLLACWARGTQGGVKYDFTTKMGRYFSERLWLFSKENLTRMDDEERLVIKGDNIYRKLFLSEHDGQVLETIWENVSNAANAADELKDLFDSIIFDTPKPEPFLKRILEIASNRATFPQPLQQGEGAFPSKIHSPSAREGGFKENSIDERKTENLSMQQESSSNRKNSINQKSDVSLVLDFFVGSGTTLAVAQKLGRKWLGVEMGEHFYNVIIPRLKKVIAGFQSGISKECDYKGGGAFRYYELESYEEALSHCEYVLKDSSYYKSSLCHSEPALAGEESQRDNKRDISASPKYGNELYKGKDYIKAEAILDYRKSRKLIDRLNKGEIVSLDMHTEYRQDFDIFQTIANLMGWKIKRLFLDSNNTESCEFDNGEILSLDSLDLAKYPKLKNLIWWE